MNEQEKTIFMSEQEKTLLYKTSIILRKDTSKMSLNDIIEELVHVIESKQKMPDGQIKNRNWASETINLTIEMKQY